MAIHIKKSHKGRFTAYKKRTGKTTEQALHSKNPHVRQMANFARNAKKWSHKRAEGGETLPNYNLPYGQLGAIGANLVDMSVPVDETTGKGVIGKDIASDALRMAGTGASIGTMIAPGIGTAIGAGAGALLGAGEGFIRGKSEKKDYIAEAQKDRFQRQQSIYDHKPYFFADGGEVNPNEITVEGDELEVENGRVTKDFKTLPSHKDGGYSYFAKPGRIIIPVKDREKYLNSDNQTRHSMEKRLVLNQRNKEGFKHGGRIPRYGTRGKVNLSELKPTLNQDPNNDPSSLFPIQSNLNPTEDMIGGPYQEQSQVNIPPIPSKSPNTPTNWGNIINTAATYLPPAYNAFMASGKANTEPSIYNQYTDEALNTLRGRKINMDPIKRDIFSQSRVASQPLGESQGSYLTRRTQIGANTQKALTDANIKAQSVNNEYSADYANALNNFGQQRREADFAARHQSLLNKYNKAAYLPKAVTQVEQIARENLNIPMYADLMKNKYAMSLMQQGYTRDQAKAETDKAYGVQNSNRYQWLQIE